MCPVPVKCPEEESFDITGKVTCECTNGLNFAITSDKNTGNTGPGSGGAGAGGGGAGVGTPDDTDDAEGGLALILLRILGQTEFTYNWDQAEMQCYKTYVTLLDGNLGSSSK